MASYNYDPYYDRYAGDTAHRKAGYTRVLALPGVAEQSAEFNEIQSIQRDYLERLGNAMFKDGYVVSGCELNIHDRTVTIASGRIFLEGLVREFEGATLSITGVGTERIVAYVSTEIITEREDSSLRDPAQGAENYGLPGAHREKQTVSVKIVEEDDFSEENSVQIYVLQDGDLIKNEETNDYSFITDTLAERTYDENGNFKISGISMRSLCEFDGEAVKVYVTEGKAYVKGYQVTKSSMSSISLNPSKSTRFVQSESHYYSSTIKKYELSNGPIANVQNLTCLVACIGERHYRGNIAGGYDSLNNTPVDTITRVYTKTSGGDIQEVFVPGRDYKLYNDQVDWSLTGDDAKEPAKGSTYYVDYVYNKSMVEGTDYDVENTNETAFLVFKDNGAKPDENSRMYISYNYTLGRRDLILMDSTGAITALEGVPDKMGKLLTPYNGSDAYLELGYVDVYPLDVLNNKSNANVAKVTNYDSVRFTQDNFFSMMQRIEDLEANLAQLDLERKVTDGEDVTELKGYFVDNFQSINRSDLTYNDGKGVAFTACLDYDKGELTTAADIKNTELQINSGSSDDYAVYGTIVSAPYELELALQQKYATGTMLVNPYASYGPMCQVLLDPAVDNWIDTDTIKVYDTVEQETYDVTTKTYSHGYWSVNAVYNLRGYLRTETSQSTTFDGTTVTNSVTSTVAKTIYEYMRQRKVKVTGRAFSNGMKNIYATFNEIPVDLTPEGDTVAGDNVSIKGKEYKTVNADDNGSLEASFMIPKNVPCGSVEVKLTANDAAGDEYSGAAIYSATGSLLTTTITNTTTITQRYKVLKEVHNLYASDPLAQSFMLSDKLDRNLMKLGIYFATKSEHRPLVVQVRDVVNGYPGETVYAEVSVPAKDVNIPTDPNVPVVTEVTLNQPVYCKAGKFYCFIVLSDSNAYSMYYANMGDALLGKTETLSVNPYATGVMFSSSNSSTWTAHQGSDLKFELYRSRFTGNGEILFNDVEISSKEITGLLLDAAYEDNNNSGLQWMYRYELSSGSYSDWLPIDTLVYRDLQGVTNKISLKAVITTDYSTSPFIDAGRVSLRSFVDDTNATYISKHLTEDDFDEEYQSLKISYQAAMPTGADHKVYYMDKEDGDWIELVDDNLDDGNVSLELKASDEEFTQYTWTVKKVNCMIGHPECKGSRFFKIRVDLSTSLRYNRPRIRRLASMFKYNY